MHRAAVKAGQEHVVHLDQVVEHRFICLGQKAGHERVTFGGGKSLEIGRVVTARHLSQVDHCFQAGAGQNCGASRRLCTWPPRQGQRVLMSSRGPVLRRWDQAAFPEGAALVRRLRWSFGRKASPCDQLVFKPIL